MSLQSKVRVGAHASQHASKFGFHRAEGRDPDELSHILSTQESPIKVAAHLREPIAFRCNFISLGDVTLADCAYEGTVTTKREEPGNKMLVFLPIRGNASYVRGGGEISSFPGRGVVLEPHRAIGSTRLSDSRRHLGLFINNARITECLTHLLERTIRDDLDFQPQIDLTAGAGATLIRLVREILSGVREDGPLLRSPLACRSLCDAAIYLLLQNYQNRYSDELANPGRSPAPRHVKWAIDFMHEHIADPISLSEIASAAKVSARTLQQGFRHFRNTSPMSYLHEIRLNAAHEELSQTCARASVTEIAVKWGFTHLGRFAHDYRKRFGESPSKTINKRPFPKY